MQEPTGIETDTSQVMDEDVNQIESVTDLRISADSLLLSSTKKRISELSSLTQHLVNSGMYISFPPTISMLSYAIAIPSQNCSWVIGILFQTYPYYQDRSSRHAVLKCLQSLLENTSYSSNIVIVVDKFRSETLKPGIAPSNAFVLAEWGSLLLQYCADNPKVWDKHGLDIVMSQAQVLELCLSSKARPKIKNSALVVTRRALRQLFVKNTIGADAISLIVTQLTAKSTFPGLKSAVFLGIVCEVCARLPPRRAILENLKSLLYSFYVREVVGSRSLVPQHLVMAFNGFFSNFATLADLLTNIVPAFEKALLRAPEIVLKDLVSPLVLSLPSSLDLAHITAEHLLKPLLSNIKSQNVVIRDKAVEAFAILITRSYDRGYLEKITDNVLLPISSSKVAVAEQRMLYGRMLSLIPFMSSRSKLVCDGLTQILTKEPNELALASEIFALTKHLKGLLAASSGGPSDHYTPIIDAFMTGLSDKRPSLRRIWAMRAGELLWQLREKFDENPIIVQFINNIMPALLKGVDEVVLNPQHTGQWNLVVASYVVIALSDFILTKIKKEELSFSANRLKIYDRVLLSNPKLSVLLNHRIYAKISSNEEYIWIIRALEASSSHLLNTESISPSDDAWAQAFIYLITAEAVPIETQRVARSALTSSYLKNPAVISRIIICGLWNWHRNVEMAEKDTSASIAKTGNTKLNLVVHSICLPPSSIKPNSPESELDELRIQLIDMLVLCRPEIIPQISWIEICLRVGQDPGTLVEAKAIQCIKKIEDCLYVNETEKSLASIELAAYNSAADLAFVAPNAIIPLLLDIIQKSLPANITSAYGPTEVAISHTPEGTLFIDVLNKSAQKYLPDKNSPDYDTIKWEEEVRNQLAKKKGQERKLTADEKARVEAQLLKENKIRKEVKNLERVLKRGIGFINALVTGPPIDNVMWLGKSLKALIDIIIAGAANIVGGAADEAYLECSSVVSLRLGTLRRFIGIATLRSLGFSNLPRNFEEEPLGGQYIAVLMTFLSLLTS